MAATLMYIKSRELLPVDQQAKPEEEDDDEDPRWELIRRLVEYKKFKDAAVQLQSLETRQENSFPRLPVKPEFETDDAVRPGEVSIFDLINAVGAILKRVGEKEGVRDIFEDKWTVSEKIEMLVKVVGPRAEVRFSELFESATSRSEVVVTFLALLELIRLRRLATAQPDPFGEIFITTAPPQDNAAPAEGTTAAAPSPAPEASASGEAAATPPQPSN
jgi:segregation and condensation protein A